MHAHVLFYSITFTIILLKIIDKNKWNPYQMTVMNPYTLLCPIATKWLNKEITLFLFLSIPSKGQLRRDNKHSLLSGQRDRHLYHERVVKGVKGGSPLGVVCGEQTFPWSNYHSSFLHNNNKRLTQGHHCNIAFIVFFLKFSVISWETKRLAGAVVWGAAGCQEGLVRFTTCLLFTKRFFSCLKMYKPFSYIPFLKKKRFLLLSTLQIAFPRPSFTKRFLSWHFFKPSLYFLSLSKTLTFLSWLYQTKYLHNKNRQSYLDEKDKLRDTSGGSVIKTCSEKTFDFVLQFPVSSVEALRQSKGFQGLVRQQIDGYNLTSLCMSLHLEPPSGAVQEPFKAA